MVQLLTVTNAVANILFITLIQIFTWEKENDVYKIQFRVNDTLHLMFLKAYI